MITSDSLTQFRAHFNWILSPVTFIVCAISVITSITIFFIVCLSRTFRRTSNYLVANLCVVSVYHIVVSFLYTIQLDGADLWPHSQTTCYIIPFVHRLSTPVLPLTIAAISLDRSVVARNPLDYPSKNLAILKILFIWSFSFILLIPRALMSVYDSKIEGTYKCKKGLLYNNIYLHSSYAVVTLCVTYLIPTYILIKEFLAMRCKMKFLTTSQIEQKKRFERRVRVMKNACIFTSIFLTCWLPTGLFQFPFDLPQDDVINSEVLKQLVGPRNFFRQMTIFNSCLNPILLLVLSFDIREFLSSCCV